MKLKKLCLVLASLCLMLPVFAQSDDAQSVGITDSDMKNFIKNWDKIEKDLDKLDCEIDGLSTYDDAEAARQIEKALQKNGVSGPSALAKVVTIYSAVSIETYERAINSDPLTKALLSKTSGGRDPFAEARENLNRKDYDVVIKYYPELCKALDIEEPAVSSDSDKSRKSGRNDKYNRKANDDDDDFWTDEDDEELKEAIKDEVKEEIKRQAREDIRNGFRRGARNMLPF